MNCLTFCLEGTAAAPPELEYAVLLEAATAPSIPASVSLEKYKSFSARSSTAAFTKCSCMSPGALDRAAALLSRLHSVRIAKRHSELVGSNVVLLRKSCNVPSDSWGQ
jgi:hypothetical protein